MKKYQLNRKREIPRLRDRETEIISYTSSRFFENQPNELVAVKGVKRHVS